MKNISKITLLLLLLTLAVFAVTSCTDPSIDNIPNSGSIAIAEDGMPQLVYVVGEDLDLSNGFLTVDTGDGKQEIALDAEGVTVTGYDKNKLGDQVITVNYGGQSTQFTVTVVARMQAIEFVTDYLVGDEMDLSKGRLKITRNDGTNYTVILSNEKVTLSGFDPKTAATQTVTASYDSGDGVYECAFDVVVHAIDSVKFNAPTKLTYKSHEEGLDITGASFTLSGKGGELTRSVAVTEDMVSGFDLSAVTEENSTIKQTLTVKYDGKDYNYDVTLTYTDISLFKKHAVSFADIDWNGEEWPEIDEELGELALKMIEIYCDLSAADKTYISSEESLPVARAALMYGLEAMDDDFAELQSAFIIAGGDLHFVCESPEAMEKAIEHLENYESDIYRVSPIINNIVETFAEEEVIEGYVFAEFAVYDPDSYEILIDLFEYMLDLHDKFESIPADWRTVGVNTYENKIQSVYNFIVGSDYRQTFGEAFYFVNEWRAERDAFDILYAYYYGKNDMESLKVLASVKLPTELEELSSYIYDALDQVDSISNYLQLDTSVFLYDYHMALKLADEIKTGDNQMAKDLYETLPINTIFGFDDSVSFYFDDMIEYLRTMEGGFYHYSGGLLGIEEYHALMQKYIEVLFKLAADDENLTYEKSEQYGKDIEAMFNMYVDLTPGQQFNFICTLNAFYGINIPPLAFDDMNEEFGDFTCFFVNIINDYYRSKLSEDSHFVYNDLVIAMEIFAQRYSREGWVEEFTAKMDGIKDAYDKMSTADKAAFDLYLKGAYDKYAAIRQRFVEPNEKTALGEWADDFDALKEAIVNVELAYYIIEEYSGQGQVPPYGMFFSAFERAQEISAYILANAPQTIIDAYYYESIYSIDETIGGTGEEGTDTSETEIVYTSIDYMMNLYRPIYIGYQVSMMSTGNIYDLYSAGKLGEFYSKTYDLTWTFLYSDDDPATADFDKDKVMAVVNMFHELSLDERVLFTMIEGEASYHYIALDAFLQEAFTTSAATAAAKLIAVEQYLMIYENLKDTESLEALKTTVEDLKTTYTALSGEDKMSFAPFEEMYTYYIETCEDLIADAEANA